jgi:antitoxin component of MazEF toxin-antitoxin module
MAMANKDLKDKNIRKLTKMGGGRSMGLTLPIEIIKKLGWKERQKVVVNLKGKHIIIKDWKS